MNTENYLANRCWWCNKPFTSSEEIITDDLEGSDKVFCSKACYDDFYGFNNAIDLLELDDIIYHECPSCGQGCDCLDQPCSHHHDEQQQIRDL